MANVTITDLSAGSALSGPELFEMVQTGASAKTTANAIKTFTSSSPTITGATISTSTLNSCTINAATGSFGSLTISTGAIPFSTITNRAYGQFQSNNDQSDGANTAIIVSFSDAFAGNTNVTMVSSTQITCAVAGTYQVTASYQFANTDTSDHTASFWFRKNGVDIADTATTISVPRASYGGVTMAQVSILETVTAGQYFELVWSTDNSLVKLDYTAASASNPTRPAIPSVIGMVVRIG